VPVADIKNGYHGNKESCRQAFLSAQRTVHLYPGMKLEQSCKLIINTNNKNSFFKNRLKACQMLIKIQWINV